jgi:uncharacterized membrane protein
LSLKDPETMYNILGNVLRLGVIVSAIVISFGFALFLAQNPWHSSSSYLEYHPNIVPHGNFDVGLSGIASGLVALNAFAVIELGLLILLATPVSRVFLSIILFRMEGDIIYVYLTTAVFLILLFSMLVTPFIPIFGG